MRIEMKILNKEFYWDGQEHLCNGAINFKIPAYATLGSAAIDLVCTEDLTIYPGETKMIPTGLAIWIGSENYKTPRNRIGYNYGIAGLILPRSGLGTKGLILANTVGLIDEDYQGELMVSAWNRNNKDEADFIDGEYVPKKIKLKAGDRFAQLVFMPFIKAQFDIVEEFSNETERGAGGFGHTGDK